MSLVGCRGNAPQVSLCSSGKLFVLPANRFRTLALEYLTEIN